MGASVPRPDRGRFVELRKWWDKYTTPLARQEDDARREYMSRVVLLTMTALLIFFTLVVALGWIAGWFKGLDVLIMVAITLPVAIAWFSSLQGAWRAASFVPTLVFLALGVYSTYTGGFFYSLILSYGIAVMLAGMLLGKRMAWVAVLLCLVGHLGTGWWVERSTLFDMLFVAIPYTGFLVGITVLQQFSEHRLHLALDKARQYAWQLNIEMEERKEAQERLLHRNRELLLLNQLVAAATSTLETDKTLEFTIRELTRGLDVTHAFAALIDDRNENLTVVAATVPGGRSSLSDLTIPVGPLRIYAEQLERQKYLILSRRELDQANKLLPGLMLGENLEILLIVPIGIHEQLFGILGLASQEVRRFTAEEILLARNAAAAVAQAVDNTRLYGRVQRLAIRDELTDLLNRRGLFEFGQREVERAQRFRRDLGVIFIDADGLKSINDQHGHSVGDLALRGFAGLIRSGMREVDLVARYGGDEFVILLAETNLSQALEVANRLLRLVQSTPVVEGDLQIYLTASLGVITLTDDMADLKALIEAGDHAMYAAKQAGRNRIAAPQVSA